MSSGWLQLTFIYSLSISNLSGSLNPRKVEQLITILKREGVEIRCVKPRVFEDSDVELVKLNKLLDETQY